MIPRLHPKGTSFMGAAAYVLHDKDGASTSDRVAWAETRNMATDDPHVGARVMAATAMDQDRLKAEAGVKNTGRKSAKSVLHFSLAWHKDEAAELIPEEMQRAARQALKALGAENHQAIIAAHSDEEHPHVHIIVNRVDPETGKMLSSSKEKLRLSEWAQGYEEERGQILCEQRPINNAERDRLMALPKSERSKHLFVRAPDHPRPEAANDNLDVDRRKKLAALHDRGRDLVKRHTKALAQLEEEHRAQLVQIRERATETVRGHYQEIGEAYRPRWEYRFHEQQAELRAFDRDEGKFQGRMRNRLKAIDFAGMITAGDRKRAITESFRALGSSGARLEALRRSQEVANRELTKQQRVEESAAARSVAAARDTLLREQREQFLAQRSSLILAQDMEKAALQASWREMNKERDRRPQVVEKERESAGSGDGGRAMKPSPKKAPDVADQFEHAAAAPEPDEDRDDDQEERRLREFVARKQREREQQQKSREPDHDRGIDD